MKYLSTIRNVSNKYSNTQTEDNDENENSTKYDLMYANHHHVSSIFILRFYSSSEFQDGTCIDAYDVVFILCEWFKTYFYEENKVITRSSSRKNIFSL